MLASVGLAGASGDRLSPWCAAVAQGAPSEGAGVPVSQVAPLVEALGLPDLLPVLRAEGLAYADDLAAGMFPGRDPARWTGMAGRIYRTDRMRAVMEQHLARGLSAADVDALVGFFTSDLGQRIVALEVSAREALLDEAVDEASREMLDRMRAEDDPRLEVLRRFIDANDLVERNVVGALNSNFAFYEGLDAGGAFGGEMSEAQMLADVWNQEAEIRDETIDWAYSYLGMAYRPLSDAEIDAYVALSQTPAGQALNAALFDAFDALFVEISRDLGRAAAQFMAGEDI